MRRPQIAVIGRASGPPETMELAASLGAALVGAGYRVVCGGLSGVMEAVARGARAAPEANGSDVIGILPTVDAASANDFIDVVIPTGMGHARNVLVVSSGDVVVAISGGAGTLSEIALAWQLNKPVVALTAGGGWAEELAGRSLDDRRPSDVIIEARTVNEVLKAIRTALGHDSPAP